MNMSYCRYRNTLTDMRDCINDAVEHINEEAEWVVDDDEIKAFRTIVKEMFEFMKFCEVIDFENECINEEELDECCFRMEIGE